ncbi:hypothetical protein [Planctomycetes bacterium Pan216]|uniref:hypothetical protein n=1 Tax=Kolteria novifilia TaxID=2527975 RepID=UPI00119F9D21
MVRLTWRVATALILLSLSACERIDVSKVRDVLGPADILATRFDFYQHDLLVEALDVHLDALETSCTSAIESEAVVLLRQAQASFSKQGEALERYRSQGTTDDRQAAILHWSRGRALVAETRSRLGLE